MPQNTSTSEIPEAPYTDRIALVLFGLCNKFFTHWKGKMVNVNYTHSLKNYKETLFPLLKKCTGAKHIDIYLSTQGDLSSSEKKGLLEAWNPVKYIFSDSVDVVQKAIDSKNAGRSSNEKYVVSTQTLFRNARFARGLKLVSGTDAKGSFVPLCPTNQCMYRGVVMTRFDLHFSPPKNPKPFYNDRVCLVSRLGAHAVCDNFYWVPQACFHNFYTTVYKCLHKQFHSIKNDLRKGEMNIHFIQDEPDRCVSDLSFYSIVRMSNRGKIFHDQNWREHFEPEERMKRQNQIQNKILGRRRPSSIMRRRSTRRAYLKALRK